jgi:DNA topoisomerase-1
MSETTRVIAGRCTTVFEGSREQEQQGEMLVLVKPDGTVLVHDVDGYQPVAWLTRAESVTVTDHTVVAQDGEQSLEVRIDDEYANHDHPAGEAGQPVGPCPSCHESLLRSDGRVFCPDCDHGFGLPSQATVLDTTCSECGLPRMRVERGDEFELCLDRNCESLDRAVEAQFDREWSCPVCDGDLRVLRRGGLILGCEEYPDCETGFAVPAGIHDGDCACGLPAFETPTGRRCLDSTCERMSSDPRSEGA